jgi:hypothetical protein
VRIALLCFGATMALFVVGNALCASSPYKVVKPDPQALATAVKWLSMVDTGNYTEAYTMLPARLKSGGDAIEKQWVGYQHQKRRPLGIALSRKFIKAYFTRTLPGAPDGYYELFMYKTSFEHKAQAYEAVTLTRESGHWQVSGYRFR